MTSSQPPASDPQLPPLAAGRRAPPAWVKPVTEYAPLAAFFLAYLGFGLMEATAVLMVATVLALGVSWLVGRHIPMMPLVTAGIIGVFGALTLWLNDETFIKLKPTIVQVLFAAVLLGGLALGRSPVRFVLGGALSLDPAGWRLLTLRFGLFFLVMAALNEVVWRTQSTDVWVTFKVFGIIVLTFGFALAQAPLISRHQVERNPET